MYITDKAYTKEEILTMESKILKALKYQVTIASTHSFLVRYLKAAHADRYVTLGNLTSKLCFALQFC